MTPTTSEIEFATTSLLIALRAHDRETANHAVRVQTVALNMGRAMNLSGNQLWALKIGSLLHDLGKLQTPDAILRKPTALTDEEWGTMRLHPYTGGMMLRALNFPEPVCLIVEQHHEHWNGRGYPYGLAQDEISCGARILAVADSYDAIVSDRCYHPGESAPHGRTKILWDMGRQFDPRAVAAFLLLTSAGTNLAAA
ncbi:MAG: HD-GYP domain-containing protein [bacterium]